MKISIKIKITSRYNMKILKLREKGSKLCFFDTNRNCFFFLRKMIKLKIEIFSNEYGCKIKMIKFSC